VEPLAVLMRTLAMRVAYHGAHFEGFQRQGAKPTVQGALEALLSNVLDEPVEVIGAGRTDSGVHATGQVVSVQTSSRRSLPVVQRSLNRNAHGRLAVSAIWEAPPWFSARHNAARRVYEYRVHCQPVPHPLLHDRAWHVPHAPDRALLQQESALLLGRRDFKAFQAGRHDLRHFFRTVHGVDWLDGAAEGEPLLVMRIEANAFLPRMVRFIVATLLDVALSRRRPGTTLQVVRSRDSQQASAPAPARGLCLTEVRYAPECGVP
jgi:tRNA pseudouridine38-40 synthase